MEHLKLMDIRKHEIDNILCAGNFREKLEALTTVALGIIQISHTPLYISYSPSIHKILLS